MYGMITASSAVAASVLGEKKKGKKRKKQVAHNKGLSRKKSRKCTDVLLYTLICL